MALHRTNRPTTTSTGAAPMGHCRVEGCPNAAIAGGLCGKHYMRVRRTGDAPAKHTPGPKPKPGGRAAALAALVAEVASLKRENAGLLARGDADALRQRVKVLTLENADLRRQLAAKPKVVHAPPFSESEAVSKLERELKAAKTHIRSVMAENSRGWAAAKPATITKTQLRKLQKALHPDPEHKTATPERLAQLKEAAQIFGAIKFQFK